MPTYRFVYPCPRFYPSIMNVDGKSLEAKLGDEFLFPQGAPDDGCWVLAEAAPETHPAGPEPAAEPVTPVAAPEPAPDLTAFYQAASAPVTEPPAEGPKPFYFPGI